MTASVGPQQATSARSTRPAVAAVVAREALRRVAPSFASRMGQTRQEVEVASLTSTPGRRAWRRAGNEISSAVRGDA
jgi:hypothetical protein